MRVVFLPESSHIFPGHQGEEAEEESDQEEDNPPVTTWKFKAVQLTYNNASSPEWCSQDDGILKGLFDRFVNFTLNLANQLEATGVSCTMERGTSSMHVHCHSYMHLQKGFHRRGRDALEPFKFENISPHLAPNTATGKSFAGAVRYGHFYVVVPKIGSL